MVFPEMFPMEDRDMDYSSLPACQCCGRLLRFHWTNSIESQIFPDGSSKLSVPVETRCGTAECPMFGVLVERPDGPEAVE